MGCGPCKSQNGAVAEKAEADQPPARKLSKNTAQATNQGFTDNMTLLAEKVPLFRRLPKDQLPMIALACEEINFRPGQEVMREGELGHEFFMIKEGEATVMVNHKKVATLKSGDYFGESALLHDDPRSATVVALVPLVTLRIMRQKFRELGLNDLLHFANRKAVGAGATLQGRQIETKPPSAKTEVEKAAMLKALAANANLKPLNLGYAFQQMIDVAWEEDVEAGTNLINQGDLLGDYFYIVKEGVFDIVVDSGDGLKRSVGKVTKGGSFGELALLYVASRAATVICEKKGCLWVIDRTNFKQILIKKSQDNVAEHGSYLDRVELLSPLTTEEKTKVAQALVEKHFAKNDVILKQGDVGNAFYILLQGTVEIVKDGVVSATLEAANSKETAQVFGEQALMNSETRTATVKVVSPTAKVFALDRDDFDALLGPLKDLLIKHAAESIDISPEESSAKTGKAKAKAGTKGKAKKAAGKTKTPSAMPPAPDTSKAPVKKEVPRDKILREELKVLGLLGCGGFGAVDMVQHITTGETMALKAVSKGHIVQCGMKEMIKNEKMILSMTNSIFVIKLFETYVSDQNVYFLLELALGGELYATYNRKGLHGNEPCAKFYSAGVVFAFDHCHMRHIIYRDLKPENLLLTLTGQVKLTDMGLAKFSIGVTYTTCGTPDYFGPELIQSKGHTVAIDWWCLGILIYELMSGHPPFEADHPMQTYSKVMAGFSKVIIHPKCKGEVENITKSFLRPDPADRLGQLPGGIKTIQDHAWYTGFDWAKMESQEMEVPYMPVVKHATDMKNFHARKEDMPPQLHYKDDGTGWDKEFASSS